MKYGIDFTVEPLSKAYSHGQKPIKVKPFNAKLSVMDLDKAFKNPPEIREYWRIHKQKQRASKEKKTNGEPL